MTQVALIPGRRLGDEIEITSLAEGVTAHLIARGWDARGYWRWVPTRRGRRVRQFFVLSNTGIPTKVYGLDLPHAFRPLSPLAKGDPPRLRSAEEEPRDLNAALALFERRLLTAILCDEAETDPARKWLRVKTTNYQTSAAPGDYPTGINTRFRPTPEQVADAAVLMPLIAKLDTKPSTALRLKALGFSTKSTAERMHTNAAKVRHHVGRAVAQCWRDYPGRKPHFAARRGSGRGAAGQAARPGHRTRA